MDDYNDDNKTVVSLFFRKWLLWKYKPRFCQAEEAGLEQAWGAFSCYWGPLPLGGLEEIMAETVSAAFWGPQILGIGAVGAPSFAGGLDRNLPTKAAGGGHRGGEAR